MARRGFPIIGSLLFVLLFLSPMILADQEQLLELAKDVSDDKLHAALHNYNDGKFKHGIFPGDRPALEAVHRERAADATALVLLAKRQSTNTTQSTSTHTSSTTQLPPSTQTSSSSTTPTSATTTTTRTTTAPTSTVPPSTDSASSTATPAPSQSPSTKLTTSRTTKTITGENGQPSTTTEVTVIVAQPTDEAPVSEPSPTPGPPKMQPNGVNGLKVRWIEAAGAAGAAAMVFFML